MTQSSFTELINKPILASLSTSLTYRQLILQIMQPLSQYPLFLNPVTQDFPNLTEQYLAKIKYPISIKEIRQKLQPKNLKYQKVGEVFRDFVLLIENCREFNALSESILLQAMQFQEAVEQQLKEFCRKANAESFSYSFLKEQIFQNDFAPFEQQKQAKMLKNEDFFAFQKNFQLLTPEKQGKALTILINELDDYEGGDVVIQFTPENFKQFWWFNGVVEQILQEKDEESSEESTEGTEVTNSETADTLESKINEV